MCVFGVQILVGIALDAPNEEKTSLGTFYQTSQFKSYDSKTKQADGSGFRVKGGEDGEY